jgi:hypothetical protein
MPAAIGFLAPGQDHGTIHSQATVSRPSSGQFRLGPRLRWHARVEKPSISKGIVRLAAFSGWSRRAAMADWQTSSNKRWLDQTPLSETSHA